HCRGLSPGRRSLPAHQGGGAAEELAKVQREGRAFSHIGAAEPRNDWRGSTEKAEPSRTSGRRSRGRTSEGTTGRQSLPAHRGGGAAEGLAKVPREGRAFPHIGAAEPRNDWRGSTEKAEPPRTSGRRSRGMTGEVQPRRQSLPAHQGGAAAEEAL